MRRGRGRYFFFLSVRRLSLMICKAASSMTVMPSSLAMATICASAAFKNTRGILVSFAYRFAEKFPVVGNKIQRYRLVAQDILCRIGRIAAFEQHGVAFFSRYVVRKTQRIRSEIGHSVFGNRADKYGRHREKGGSLVKIIHDPQVFEIFHHDTPFCVFRKNTLFFYYIYPKRAFVKTRSFFFSVFSAEKNFFLKKVVKARSKPLDSILDIR